MSRRKWYLTGLALFAMASLYAACMQERHVGSTFSSGPHGAKAFFRLLLEEGFPVSHWLMPYSELATSTQEGSVLFIVAPEKRFDDAPLIEWIKRGNRVVLFADRGSSAELLLKQFGVTPKPRLWAFSKTLLHSGPSLSCSQKIAECRGVDKLSLDDERLTLKAPAVSVVGSNEEAAIAQVILEKGDVWILASSSVLRNALIDEGDNARLLYQLAAGRKEVLFDEFHHGYVMPVSAASRPRWQALLLLIGYLTLALVLVALSRSIRFGRPRQETSEPVHATSDFAIVLGLLYAEHTPQAALPLYLKSWRRRLERTRGISTKLDEEAVAEKLGHINNASEQHFRSAIGAMRGSNVRRSELERSVQALEQIITSFS